MKLCNPLEFVSHQAMELQSRLSILLHALSAWYVYTIISLYLAKVLLVWGREYISGFIVVW